MKIAIKANPDRGKEIISLLESLGGINSACLKGNSKDFFYYIKEDKTITCWCPSDDYRIYTLEEFEREFPFKIGDKVFLGEDDECLYTIKSISVWYDEDIVYELAENELYYSANKLTLYKEIKEERNITLTLDKAKEWYKKGGELKEIALQAFTEKELNPLPISWEEFCRKHKSVCLSTRYANMPLKYDALIKLEQLRNCWWNGWEPEWNNCEKYVIKWDNNDLIIFTARNIRAFLVFPTREMAYEFLNCFRSLIEKAGDLI